MDKLTGPPTLPQRDNIGYLERLKDWLAVFDEVCGREDTAGSYTLLHYELVLAYLEFEGHFNGLKDHVKLPGRLTLLFTRRWRMQYLLAKLEQSIRGVI